MRLGCKVREKKSVKEFQPKTKKKVYAPTFKSNKKGGIPPPPYPLLFFFFFLSKCLNEELKYIHFGDGLHKRYTKP